MQCPLKIYFYLCRVITLRMKNFTSILNLINISLSSFILTSCMNERSPGLPQLETETITFITETTAKSGGNILSNGGADIISKGVCWGPDVNPITSGANTSDGSGDAMFISTLIELIPDREYHVRAYATNIAGTGYGDEWTFRTLPQVATGQIIADHNIVDDFDKIPQEYINRVKEMWFVYAGESHSAAIRTGLTLLEAANSKYQVSIKETGIPQSYTNQYLRASRATWGDYNNSTGWIYDYGEEDWFTNSTAVSRTKAGITYCNTHSLAISAIGFGWCTDMLFPPLDPDVDPVYGCRWFGSSVNGPEGNHAWGLDAEDHALTGNTVCLDTYLAANQSYIDFCATNGYSTKVFFTTGPVNGSLSVGEGGYQGYLKEERIRAYVKSDPTRILFDYADILCYDDDGTHSTTTWNGHPYPVITVINYGDGSIGHISSAGALRLAKAVWWMLARMAGWNGN
jgi:hypothetical protein